MGPFAWFISLLAFLEDWSCEWRLAGSMAGLGGRGVLMVTMRWPFMVRHLRFWNDVSLRAETLSSMLKSLEVIIQTSRNLLSLQLNQATSLHHPTWRSNRKSYKDYYVYINIPLFGRAMRLLFLSHSGGSRLHLAGTSIPLDFLGCLPLSLYLARIYARSFFKLEQISRRYMVSYLICSAWQVPSRGKRAEERGALAYCQMQWVVGSLVLMLRQGTGASAAMLDSLFLTHDPNRKVDQRSTPSATS